MKWYYKLILLIFCAPVGIYFIIRDSIRQIKTNKKEGKYTKEYYSNISSDFKEGSNDLKKTLKELKAEAATLEDDLTPDGQRVSDKRHKYQEQIDIINNKDCEYCHKPRRICDCVINEDDNPWGDELGRNVNLEDMFDLYDQVQIPILDDKWAQEIADKYKLALDDKIYIYAQFLIEMKKGDKEPTSDNFDNWYGWDYLEKCENELQRKILLDDLTDISGVSDKISRTILDQYPTIESIKSATEEELIEIPGVGKGLAKAIKARIG